MRIVQTAEQFGATEVIFELSGGPTSVGSPTVSAFTTLMGSQTAAQKSRQVSTHTFGPTAPQSEPLQWAASQPSKCFTARCRPPIHVCPQLPTLVLCTGCDWYTAITYQSRWKEC